MVLIQIEKVELSRKNRKLGNKIKGDMKKKKHKEKVKVMRDINRMKQLNVR